MKKLWLFSVLSVGLILLSGCSLKWTPSQTAWSDDVMWVYKEAWEMTCLMTYKSDLEEWTSTIYVKDGMIKQETSATIDGEDYSISTLARDGKMYMWWDMYGEEAGFSMTYNINIEEELGSFEDLDENTTISCTKWVKKNSVFDLPKNIEFSSMDDLGDLMDLDLEWDDMLIEEGDEVAEVVEEANEVEEAIQEETAGVSEEAVEEVEEEAEEATETVEAE